MIHLQLLEELNRHMEWADSAVWKAILAAENGPTDGKLRETLYHLHMVQHAFLRTWKYEPRETPYPVFAEAGDLLAWGRSFYGEANAFLNSITEEKLAEPFPMPWANMVEQRLGRPPEVTTFGETALQVVLHTQYHRGQVNARLREIGGEPPLVDYIAWIWLGRPGPEWQNPDC